MRDALPLFPPPPIPAPHTPTRSPSSCLRLFPLALQFPTLRAPSPCVAASPPSPLPSNAGKFTEEGVVTVQAVVLPGLPAGTPRRQARHGAGSDRADAYGSGDEPAGRPVVVFTVCNPRHRSPIADVESLFVPFKGTFEDSGAHTVAGALLPPPAVAAADAPPPPPISERLCVLLQWRFVRFALGRSQPCSSGVWMACKALACQTVLAPPPPPPLLRTHVCLRIH